MEDIDVHEFTDSSCTKNRIFDKKNFYVQVEIVLAEKLDSGGIFFFPIFLTILHHGPQASKNLIQTVVRSAFHGPQSHSYIAILLYHQAVRIVHISIYQSLRLVCFLRCGNARPGSGYKIGEAYIPFREKKMWHQCHRCSAPQEDNG